MIFIIFRCTSLVLKEDFYFGSSHKETVIMAPTRFVYIWFGLVLAIKKLLSWRPLGQFIFGLVWFQSLRNCYYGAHQVSFHLVWFQSQRNCYGSHKVSLYLIWFGFSYKETVIMASTRLVYIWFGSSHKETVMAPTRLVYI